MENSEIYKKKNLICCNVENRFKLSNICFGLLNIRSIVSKVDIEYMAW